MAARTWLTSLSSGEERTAASSITDPAFLQLFLDLLSRSDAEATVPLSLEEITALYDKHLSASPLIVSNGSTSKSPPSNGKAVDGEDPEKMVKESTNPVDLSDAQPDVATLLQGGNVNVDELGAPSSQGGVTISKLLNMLLSHVYALLPAAFSPEVGQVEKLLVGSSDDGGEKKNNKGQSEDSSEKGKVEARLSYADCSVAALSLDPGTFRTEGDNILFYNLVDKIMGLLVKDEADKEQGKAEEGKFLSQTVESESIWPSWLVNNYTAKTQVPLGLILLAGFEMSINSSYGRSLNELPQNVMLHIGGESTLHKVWGEQSDRADAVKIAEKIERVFCVRKMLMEKEEKVASLVSKEEWSHLESNIHSDEGTLKGEHLLAIPMQWLALASSVKERCVAWNASMADMWSKLVKNILSERQEQIQKQEEEMIEDFNNVEESAAPIKKKKKKSKKKNKKKSSNPTEPSNQKQQAEPADQPSTTANAAEVAPSATYGVNSQKSAPKSADFAVEQLAKPLNSTDEKKKDDDPDHLSNTTTASEVELQKPPLGEKKFETRPPESTAAESKDEDKIAKEEESKAIDDADEWETVAVKTRKPKAKQTNDQSNNKSSSGNRTSNSSRNNGSGGSNTEGGNSNDRRKGKKRNGNARDRDKGKRNQLKAAKEVLTQILDAVDDEVSRREKQKGKSVSSNNDRRRSANHDKHSSASANNNRSNHDQRQNAASVVVPSAANSSWNQQSRTMRDVVAGVTTAPVNTIIKPACDSQENAKSAAPDAHRGSKIKPGLSYKSVIEPTHKQPAVTKPPRTNEAKTSEKAVNVGVKEAKNFAPAVSEKTAATTTPHDKNKLARPGVNPEVEDPVTKEEPCQSPPSAAEDDQNTPPLSTLLGPGTSCSATSSVASSLEAPFSSRFRHQSISSTEDVGVHLLNVCKQLSEEIDTFMARRSQALDIRRKERSAVLSALQDTLVKIWPGNCHVEMYGSCATQLDLPSSDLDLVVCGLDEIMMNQIPIDHTSGNEIMSPSSSAQNLQSPSPGAHDFSSPVIQNFQHQQSFDSSSQQMHQSFDNSIHTMPPSPGEHQASNNQDFNVSMVESNPDEIAEFLPEDNSGMVYDASEENVMGMEGYNSDYHQNQQEYYYVPYNYIPPMSLNAQRVIRLASELEMQPWAVQVKAIPTAAVPVVKILADPSKLPGAMGTGDNNWMMQQHIAAQAGAPGTPPVSPEQIPTPSNQFSTSSHFFSRPSMPSWRGADIMNGLQPVDITFEGPEHGGIGSTTYSSCVVQDACNETGLSPEKTPVVQVKMVLKELLAQRRLNEPFTGGLSSYALLLLLLAVVKERQIIQEEMARVEKQRQEVNQVDTRDTKPSQKQTANAPRLSAAQIVAGKGASSKSSNSKIDEVSQTVDSSNKTDIDKKIEATKVISKEVSSSSWASIAKKSNGSTARTDSMSTATISNSSSLVTKKNTSEKSKTPNSSTIEKKRNSWNKSNAPTPISSGDIEAEPTQSKINVVPQSKVTVEGQINPPIEEDMKPPLIPQCSNDVLEVLCSGEMTAGKLLMHFLLFYGQHFDAQATLIDVNGTHHPEYGTSELEKLSPFVTRPPGGNIDPITGMYSVDPIVVYDPLEGAMDHNVAKRCYCWNNVRWVLAQSYMTVSSIVETSGTSSKMTTKQRRRDKKKTDPNGDKKCGDSSTKREAEETTKSDITSPILELLLSF